MHVAAGECFKPGVHFNFSIVKHWGFARPANHDRPAGLSLTGSDLDNVTRTIIAEAGQNGTPASMAAVASVIRNRLAAGGYGKTATEVVHQPYQFTPWNSGSGNDPRRFEADSPAAVREPRPAATHEVQKRLRPSGKNQHTDWQ